MNLNRGVSGRVHVGSPVNRKGPHSAVAVVVSVVMFVCSTQVRRETLGPIGVCFSRVLVVVLLLWDHLYALKKVFSSEILRIFFFFFFANCQGLF